MEEFFPILTQCALFSHIDRSDLGAMLSCLGARVLSFHKNQFIFTEGDPAQQVGVVLSGSAQIIKEDFYGNRSIVARIAPGELFGESFACAGVEVLPVSAVAAEPCQAMLLDRLRITISCTNACQFHSQMILNLLQVMAQKNLIFNQKVEILSRRTTREKLMTYLLAQAKKQGGPEFTIPYDRQALADYLGVERSAMSAELGKLKREGVMDFEKSRFRLL